MKSAIVYIYTAQLIKLNTPILVIDSLFKLALAVSIPIEKKPQAANRLIDAVNYCSVWPAPFHRRIGGHRYDIAGKYIWRIEALL